jgi:hypothetical protein
MLMLSLSASFVGSTIPLLDNIASLMRWVSIFLLLIFGILQRRLKPSWGFLLFWGYVFFGLLFLLRANSVSWQSQRGLLLFIVALAIPLAYSNDTYKSLKRSLLAIAVAATAYSLFNFITLPTNLSESARFAGYFKGAPAFA